MTTGSPRGPPQVSSRRNASLVVAVGVASLAATSFAAMVATSELLAESISHPVAEEFDPPIPDLGRPDVIQVEPPRERRAKRSGGRPKEAIPYLEQRLGWANQQGIVKQELRLARQNAGQG